MLLRFRLIFFVLGLLLISGCATDVSQPGRDAENAEQLFASGQYEEATKAFIELARQSAKREKNQYLLRASAAAARSDNVHQARQILKTVELEQNNPLQQFLLRLTEAHIAIMERRAENVLDILIQPPSVNMPYPYLADYFDLRADAQTMLGNRLETARELVKREVYLKDDALIAANQQDIWKSLGMLSERALQQLRTDPPPDILSGWMELVQITKTYQLHPTSLKDAVVRWRQSYPGHPARPELLKDLQSRKLEDFKPPQSIAVLLPLSGKYAKAAEAVRDGFLAAYYQRQNDFKQTVQIYDVGNEENILVPYQQAINEGAEFIIGPLSKQHIEQLAEGDDLPVPTLALNYIQTEEIPNNLYQFGLSPESEARQVAERTWLDGHVNAAVLAPAGPWGERVYNAFESRWKEIGGDVVNFQTYNTAKNDYSNAIRSLLNIDASKRRSRAISSLLNQNIKYTPRRRQDIDFIFLAAYPRQARQIRPQLKFYHATTVPVYATSHVFTGNLNPERDRDMNGLMFGDMPWVLTDGTTHRNLRTEISPYISKAGNRLQRLYALGIDSFNIITALSPLRQYPYQRYDGETGSLSLDAKLHIQRQLTWVKFRSGRPRIADEEIQ